MNIRKMVLEDYDAVYDLWIHTPGMGLNDLDDSKEGITRYLQRNPDTCFVAEVEDKIIGVIMSGHDGRRGFIYHTVVHMEYQKRGIGRKLADAAITALKKEGIHKVALLVFEKNETGNAFWENLGFDERTDIVYRNKCLSNMNRIDT